MIEADGARENDIPTRVAAVHLFAGISVLLVAGIGVSILTSPDHLWLKLYFSQLGTVHRFSGLTFNGTLMTAGLLIFLLSWRVQREVRAHGKRANSPRIGPAIVAPLVGAMGLNLSIVGMVPINTIKPVHDSAALGITIAFAILLIVAPIVVRGLGRTFLCINLPAGVIVVGGFAIMTAGLINLTLFELLGFTAMFTWLTLFFGCLVPRATRLRVTDVVRGRRRHVRRAMPALGSRRPQPALDRRYSRSVRPLSSSATPGVALSSAAPSTSGDVCAPAWSTPRTSMTSLATSGAGVSSTWLGATTALVASPSSTFAGSPIVASIASPCSAPAGSSAAGSPVTSPTGISTSGASSMGGTTTLVATAPVAAASRARRSLRVSNTPSLAASAA